MNMFSFLCYQVLDYLFVANLHWSSGSSFISVLLYCLCGCVGSSNRSPISFDPLENRSAEKQVPGDSGGVQSWTSSTEQGVVKRRQWKNDQGTRGMSSMAPWGCLHFNVSNKQKFWLTLQPPNSLCPAYVWSILEVFNKKKKISNLVLYEKYIENALWFLPACISTEFSAFLPSVVLRWQGILPPVWEKAATDWRAVPKTASFWSREGHAGKQPENPEGSEVPDRQHIHEANRALRHLEGL